MKISLSTARRLALHCQALDGDDSLHPGKEGVYQCIDRLGYVQIDTISVVERAHNHTLWARRPDYDPQMLHELQAIDRRVFEWWATAMSYVPMDDYRFYAPSMNAPLRWHRKWYNENVQLTERVLERVKAEGPLGSSDFKPPKGFKRGDWWSWKPAKIALECLFSMGKLMVTERRNFQRIYDLRERVLPPNVDLSPPSAGELARFRARRLLGSLGFGATDRIQWARWGSTPVDQQIVQDMIEKGELTSFEIEGFDGQTYCALCDRLDHVLNRPTSERPDRVHILSPFDNLVTRRGWVHTYFGFDYKLEAYTPKGKRRYGYFSLPILWGDRFVGRVDAKADRKPKTFIVRNLAIEPDFADYDALMGPLSNRFWAFASFNGCERFTVEQTEPAFLRDVLASALATTQQGAPGEP
jgi:uncharacterized protein YcaQ